MTPPTYRRGVFNFMGLVYYYCGIWGILKYTLEPLTTLTSIKVNFKWNEVEQKYFKEIRQIMGHNT